MKQLLQNLKTGETYLETLPSPQVSNGNVLIQTTHSLVSLGTERMLVEFGKASLIEKARQQPEKLTQVLDKIKTDGLLPTVETVFNKLGQPIPLGYCNVGKVIDVGKGVTEFAVGDRVVSNGPHAEIVSVPKNLVSKIPEGVSNEDATFAVIGAIGLQGVRLLKPQLGESVVVIGLGLIGLMTCQLLKANGCNVVGIDLDQTKCDLAKQWGIQTVNPSQNSPVKSVLEFTNGIGADGVLITASTKSNEVISQAAQMSRKQGRIVLVGVIGLHINRADFYEKELSFQVSCSYGPGRYDDKYEQKGIDYPLPYVRWTEKRNFEAVLHSISSGNVDVKSLITEKVPLEDYHKIYDDMQKAGSIASILVYPSDSKRTFSVQTSDVEIDGKPGVLGIIGAGNFTSSTILPALKAADAKIKYIASGGGLSAKQLAKKANISYATSDYNEILRDDSVDTVLITTRHNLHASMTIEALEHGKNVFVEKPLCLNNSELDQIIVAVEKNQKMVVVGFNRRFAPLAQKMKSLAGQGQMNIVATMNAGHIPSEVWVHDLRVGGGRIIGEACHFIDLCSYLTGSRVKSVCMNSMGIDLKENTDNVSILLKYENGSNAVINYFANGSKSYPKERIEVFSQEKTIVLNNWRLLKGYGVKGFRKVKSRMDKGHKNQFKLFVESIPTGKPIISFDEIINTTRASFAAIESLKTNSWVEI